MSDEAKKLTVMAKMRCVERRDQQSGQDVGGKTTTVRLQPVYAEKGPNASWSKYTPSGEVQLQITNPVAVDAFKLGACYLVSFDETTED